MDATSKYKEKIGLAIILAKMFLSRRSKWFHREKSIICECCRAKQFQVEKERPREIVSCVDAVMLERCSVHCTAKDRRCTVKMHIEGA